ncbi:MAG: ATP-dependent DNA helicase RecG, partial [Ruminiclostridium sp.]|nr:ATP-dependent DNA helicase RecG [Ruminiclostridium sp.]
QTALMAPTELLAQQHLKTMETLLGHTGMKIALLTGSMTMTQKRKCRQALETGEIDLIVGTHALLSEGVEFRRLGLVVTDEQHRFGVDQRAALSAKSGGDFRPHVLVMSATPIPRTLALMIYGDLDLSVIDQLPPGRTPVDTMLIGEDKRQRLYGFVRKQVGLGRQVYIVCPAVDQEDEEGMKAAQQFGRTLQNQVFPDLRVAIVHGKMKAADKQGVMASFAAGETDVLVSTTVIEVGVDVPNASLMIIENADRFGLSQLHQLRGRVGRGQHQSYCVLISDNRNETTRKRLKTLCATTDGFLIAEEDLKMRGPGDFFGSRQHGLPQLKLASLEGDMRLLHQAQDAARGLLAQDPDLTHPDHEPLRGRVEQLFRENRDIFN